MIGGDSEIGALWAAVTEGALAPNSIARPAEHCCLLLARSAMLSRECDGSGEEASGAALGRCVDRVSQDEACADREGARTILCDDDPVFVLYRVASRYGLPVAPEWAPWFMRELNQRKAITPLLGLGCSPVLVRGNKQTFLRWIGRALRERLIRILQRTDQSHGSCQGLSWRSRICSRRQRRDLKTRA